MSTAELPTVRVRVDYDFASSLCYVAHRAMQRLAPQLAAIGVELCWSPLDLTLVTGWRRGAEMDELRRANVRRVSDELGVPLVMPRVWLDSRRAHAVALCLPAEREPAWREAVFSTIYEAGRRPTGAQLDELLRALDLEVEPSALARAEEELPSWTRRARAQDVTGVPNFMLGPWPFGGIQSDDTMLSILGRFAERQRESAA